MEFTPEMLARMASVVENDRPATRDVFVQRRASSLTVSEDYSTYWNPKVTRILDGMFGAEVAYIKCKPMVEDHCVLVMPAREGELGAVEFQRAESGKVGRCNLRAALIDFNLSFGDNSNLQLPVATPDPAQFPHKVMVIDLSEPNRKRVKRRKAAANKKQQS